MAILGCQQFEEIASQTGKRRIDDIFRPNFDLSACVTFPGFHDSRNDRGRIQTIVSMQNIGQILEQLAPREAALLAATRRPLLTLLRAELHGLNQSAVGTAGLQSRAILLVSRPSISQINASVPRAGFLKLGVTVALKPHSLVCHTFPSHLASQQRYRCNTLQFGCWTNNMRWASIMHVNRFYPSCVCPRVSTFGNPGNHCGSVP